MKWYYHNSSTRDVTSLGVAIKTLICHILVYKNNIAVTYNGLKAGYT